MKKQVNPAVVVVIVVLAIGVIGFLFYKGTATPAPVNMDPHGPAGNLRQNRPGGGKMSPDVLEAQKKMQQQQQGGTPGQ